MTFKESVTKQGVQPAVWFACGCAEMIYRFHGLGLTITSMTDSHADRPGSLHNKGLAVDFRTRNIPPALLKTIYGELNNVLNPMGFDVVLESDHLHCEHQPKTPAENWQKLEIA